MPAGARRGRARRPGRHRCHRVLAPGEPVPRGTTGACRVSTPPHDLDAERAALGRLMLGGTADGMTSADFFRPAHQLIYEAVEALRTAGKPADAITVADELRRRGDLSRVGGGPYLHTCLQAAPSAAQAAHYAGIVGELAGRRKLVEGLDRVRQAALNPGADMADVRDVAAALPVLDGARTSRRAK